MYNLTVNIEAEVETGRIVAVYLKLRDGRSAKTREYEHGKAFADFDGRGRLLGIEMLAPCEPSTIDRILCGQPKIDQKLPARRSPTGSRSR